MYVHVVIVNLRGPGGRVRVGDGGGWWVRESGKRSQVECGSRCDCDSWGHTCVRPEIQGGRR